MSISLAVLSICVYTIVFNSWFSPFPYKFRYMFLPFATNQTKDCICIDRVSLHLTRFMDSYFKPSFCPWLLYHLYSLFYTITSVCSSRPTHFPVIIYFYLLAEDVLHAALIILPQQTLPDPLTWEKARIFLSIKYSLASHSTLW